MTLEDHLSDVQIKLSNKLYPNEQSISQGVVLRILQAIDWPTYDTQLVIPEYSIEGRRVDFALCNHANKPIIFIEVKQPGKTLGADKQLFEYAFHAGIPFAIVTDGKEWHFYLPAETGSYDERRVYKLDLLERDIQESSYRLLRYLGFESVKSGNALDEARKDYKNVSKTRQTKANIPIAWKKLLEEKDDMLIEIVSEKVESLCGFKASETQIIQYLSSLAVEAQSAATRTGRKNNSPIPKPDLHVPVKKPISQFKKTANKKLKVTFLDGTEIHLGKASDTMIETIRKIGFDEVMAIGIEMYGCPLVSNKKMREEKYTWSTAAPNIYVLAHSNTRKKISQLHEINDTLSLGLRIEEI